MYSLEALLRIAGKNQTNVNGKWLPARPIISPLRYRILDAWAVLTGKADAVKWPGNQ